MDTSEKIWGLKEADPKKFRKLKFSHDYCLTCGICSSSCPVSGIDGFDPRKLIRFVSLGLEQKVVESRWPWICTMCGRCAYQCPMDINIVDIARHVRSLRSRDKVPGILHKGVANALKTGNNLGVPSHYFGLKKKERGRMAPFFIQAVTRTSRIRCIPEASWNHR